MVQEKTKSRALQLVAIDMSPKKPTDAEIAESWGVSDPRVVRNVRNTEEYALVLAEFRDAAISYVGEKVSRMAAHAVDHLTDLVPELAERAKDLLAVRESLDGTKIYPAAKDITAATNVAKFLTDIASRAGATDIRRRDEDGDMVTMPHLVVSKSVVGILEPKEEIHEGEFTEIDTQD